jgi:hypothetical protein
LTTTDDRLEEITDATAEAAGEQRGVVVMVRWEIVYVSVSTMSAPPWKVAAARCHRTRCRGP